MAELPLQTVVAEYAVKDLATKSVKAIDKEITKSVKSTEQFEKELKKTESLLGKVSKAAKGMGSGVAGAGKGAIGGATAVAGAATSGLGALPVVGGLMAAVIASINSVKNQFVSGLSLKKELLTLSTDVQASFKGKQKEALKAFDTSFSFKPQQEQLLSSLSNLGVDIKDMSKENLKVIENFAKSQGKDLEKVFDGAIKSGHGLTDVQKIQAQQYQAMIKADNPFTSKTGFKLMIELLKQVNPELQKVAKNNQVLTSGTQGYITAVKKKQQEMDLFMVDTPEKMKSGFKSFEAALESEKLVRNLTATVAGSANFVIKGSAKTINTLLSGGQSNEEKRQAGRERVSQLLQSQKGMVWSNKENRYLPARAKGGPVQKGKAYMVGEQGPEPFIPNESGTIIPNSQINNIRNKNNTINNNFNRNESRQNVQNNNKTEGNRTINFNPVFNIYGDNGNMKNQISGELDNMARSLAHYMGIPLPQ